MIVSILQENLAKSLNIVSKAVDGNPPLPVLGNVLLETEDSRLKLSATNLEMSISVWIGAKVEQAGSITLPARTFSELVNNLSKERVDLRLDADTHTINLRCGIQTTNLRGISADEFPPINHNEKADLYLEGKTLREMIVQTVFAAAKEQNRPILTGVYVKLDDRKLTLAAADGYRLAVREAEIDEKFDPAQDMVVPARAMGEISRIIEDDQEVGLSLPSQRDAITIFLPNITISSQLLSGRFPDFAAIIPRSFVTTTTMYTNDLLIVCQRAEIFARDNANSASLSVTPARGAGEPAEVLIAGKSAERGDSEGMLDANAEGEKLDISFNIRYLIDVLRVIKEERVVFESNGPENPGVLRPENRNDFVHVIMPMSR